MSSRLVHSPCITCPTMNSAGPFAAAASTDPITSKLA